MADKEILTKKQRREMNRQENLKRQQREQRRNKFKQYRTYFIISFVIIAAGSAAVWLVDKQPILPPTTMQGHVEKSPASHIVDGPMDVAVHKHMLEHADGSGPPGVIINYNCADYACAPDLLDKLAALVDEYPANLYLAPYSNMSAKLVITRLGKQAVLTEYDEEKIRAFIEQ